MFYNISSSLFSRFLVAIRLCCHDGCVFIFIIFHVSVFHHHLCFSLPLFSFVEWCNNFQSESQVNFLSFISLLFLLLFFIIVIIYCYSCCLSLGESTLWWNTLDIHFNIFTLFKKLVVINTNLYVQMMEWDSC